MIPRPQFFSPANDRIFNLLDSGINCQSFMHILMDAIEIIKRKHYDDLRSVTDLTEAPQNPKFSQRFV